MEEKKNVKYIGVARSLTSTLKDPIWNPVNPSLTVSTSPPVEATIGTYTKFNDNHLKKRHELRKLSDIPNFYFLI